MSTYENVLNLQFDEVLDIYRDAYHPDWTSVYDCLEIAWNKQRAQTVELSHVADHVTYKCPICDATLSGDWSYCPMCGQKLVISEEV